MKTFIVHHTDLDGLFSAGIMLSMIPDAACVPYDHGDPVPWDILGDDNMVYLVDLTLKPADMKKMADTHYLFWLDHHRTPVKDCMMSDPVLERLGQHCRFDLAGCGICWRHVNGDMPMPPLVQAVNDWDLGTRNFENDNIHFGLAIYDLRPQTKLGREMLELCVSDRFTPEMLDRLAEHGSKVKAYQAQKDRQTLANAFVCTLPDTVGGHRILLCNGGGSSYMFEGLPVFAEKKIPLCGSFKVQNGKWEFGIYRAPGVKDAPDCSLIAKELGGGGHAGAAGFQISHLPEWVSAGMQDGTVNLDL